MAVDDPRVIDFLGVNKNTGEVDLTIADHLDWVHSDHHQMVLQEKLNVYLAFVESGEILEQIADAASRPIVLHIVFKFPPDSRRREFLARRQETIAAAGFSLRYRLFEDFAVTADHQGNVYRH